MKHGKTLPELAAEISRQQNSKRDFIIPVKNVQVYAIDDHIEAAFSIKNDTHFAGGFSNTGHEHIGQELGIPKKYYDMMKAHPQLLATNIQHWVNLSSDRRMIRTLDGNVRGIMSSSYRRIDNYDLANAILPILNESGAKILSCDITERKMYIKAITEEVKAEVRTQRNVGELVYAGIEIENSEVREASCKFNPMAFVLSCKNGNIAPMYGMKKYHVGRNNEAEMLEFANDTKLAEDTAFWLKARDITKHALSETTFSKIIATMQESTQTEIKKPEAAVELISKEFNMTEGERGGVLEHLIKGGDLTVWGITNAITRMAQDVESYDRSTELETIGFALMGRKNWN